MRRKWPAQIAISIVHWRFGCFSRLSWRSWLELSGELGDLSQKSLNQSKLPALRDGSNLAVFCLYLQNSQSDELSILLKWFLASHFFYHHALTLWPLFCLFDSRFRINLILWSTESNCAARNDSLCSSRVVQILLSLGTLLCNQRHTGHIRVRWFWGAKLFFKLPVLLRRMAAAEQSVKNLR